VKRHERCRISGSASASEIPLLLSFLYLLNEAEGGLTATLLDLRDGPRDYLDPLWRQRQAGSLTGAVHLSKSNAGVLRRAQRGQKPRVEQKGKCSLDFDFQYEYRP